MGGWTPAFYVCGLERTEVGERQREKREREERERGERERTARESEREREGMMESSAEKKKKFH